MDGLLEPSLQLQADDLSFRADKQKAVHAIRSITLTCLEYSGQARSDLSLLHPFTLSRGCIFQDLKIT